MKFIKAMKLANTGRRVRKFVWDFGFYIRYDCDKERFYFSHDDYGMETEWFAGMDDILSEDWELA